MLEQEVTLLCAEAYRPLESVHRRAESEPLDGFLEIRESAVSFALLIISVSYNFSDLDDSHWRLFHNPQPRYRSLRGCNLWLAQRDMTSC